LQHKLYKGRVYRKRRNELIGHILRHDGLLGLILERILMEKIIEKDQDGNA